MADRMANKEAAFPPGRIKIVKALRELLKVKDFNSITTAEIAKTANVTEALIYKYFKNKRDLLFETLSECFQEFIINSDREVRKVRSAVEKLRMMTHCYLKNYDQDRVMARMLLLEVRSSKDFFESEAYKRVQMHSRTILNIIEEGILNKEIRNDIKPSAIRSAFFGSIEHACLAGIIFDRKIEIDAGYRQINQIFFEGILPPLANLKKKKEI